MAFLSSFYWGKESNLCAYEKLETADCIRFVRTVSDESNGGTAGDGKRENAEQALCVYASVIFLDPDGAFIGVGFLDEEGCGSGIETDTIFDGYISGNHFCLRSYL